MGLAIDWYNSIIQVTSPTTQVDMQELHDFIEDEMASPVGHGYPAIIAPEGKIEDPSQPGVFSQIIVILYAPWQVQFWGGSGYTRIYGGKLVGGKNDQPFKATGTAGDITVLESPVDGLTVLSDQSSLLQPEDIAAVAEAVWDEPLSEHIVVGTTGELMNMVDRLHVNKFLWDNTNARFELYTQADILVGYLNTQVIDGVISRSGRIELV